jgi:hypothetical protein
MTVSQTEQPSISFSLSELQTIKHFQDHLQQIFSIICQENDFYKTVPNSENQNSCQKQLNTN